MKLLPLFIGILLILAISGCTNEPSSKQTNQPPSDQTYQPRNYIKPTPSNDSIVMDFVEIGTEYRDVSCPTDVGGKLAYLVHNASTRVSYRVQPFIVYDGKEIGKEYDDVSCPINLGGKLAYSVRNFVEGPPSIEERPILFYDNNEIGEKYRNSTKWYEIDSPTLVNGKIAYRVIAGSSDSFIVYDGAELGRKYDTVNEPISFNNKLVFFGKNIRTNSSLYVASFIINDGIETVTKYLQIDSPTEVDSKLAYRARNWNGSYSVVYDGKEIGNYYNVGELTEVNKKLAFIAWSSNLTNSSFIVYDGKEIGKDKYEQIDQITDIKGKLAYRALKPHVPYEYNNYVILYDGKEVFQDYGMVESVTSVNGKLTFSVSPYESIKSIIVMEK